MAKEREGGEKEGRGEIAGAQALYDDEGFARKSQCSATPSARIRIPSSILAYPLLLRDRFVDPSLAQSEQRISILRLYPSLSLAIIGDFSTSLRRPISYDNDRRTAILFFPLESIPRRGEVKIGV